MTEVQLYIQDTSDKDRKIDLYGDETIEITSTLQDLKDVGKVFTDFSQSFTVPASDDNNKTFGHFYSPHITEGGFDTRTKKAAKIFINFVLFRRGFVQVNSVTMNHNRPASYNITFFGNTVQLKDLIKEDKLDALTEAGKSNQLTLYDHTYDAATVKGGFNTGIGVHSSVIYPLITPTKRLFFDSSLSSSDASNYSGNLISVGTDATRGLAFTDLKPAIKCSHIIEAIEGKYGIVFTRDFFGTEAFTNLFMWLSSASGDIIDYEFQGKEIQTIDITNLPAISITDDKFTTNPSVSSNHTVDFEMKKHIFSGACKKGYFVMELKITPSVGQTEKNYTIKAIDDVSGDTLAEISGIGTQTLKFNKTFCHNRDPRLYKVRFVVETYVGIVFTAEFSAKVALFRFTGYSPTFAAANSGATYTTTSKIIIRDHLPDMKIIDFLSGIFKMFNLVAFYEDDESDTDFGKIKVMTLDSFYADAVNNPTGGTIDIQDYVDISQHTVSASLPFTTIHFKFEDTDTVLMENHFVTHNKVFGNAEYTPEGYTDFGKKYDVKLPFSHLKYEHLLDLGDNQTQTEIQWGYAAGGNFNEDTGNYSSKNIKPLLFYGIYQTISSANHYINWISGSEDAISTYWRPSNANEAPTKDGSGVITAPPDFMINFDSEVDEFELTDYNSLLNTSATGFEQGDEQQLANNSLFKKFYSSYIRSVFNPLKKVVKFTAYLPPNVIIRYKLNDQLKFQDNIYRINSITTDIRTGKSTLELLNLFEGEIV